MAIIGQVHRITEKLRLEAMKKEASDSSLHSEDRVLQPENEKERDSGDRTFQAQEERGRNRSVKL